MLLRRSSLVGRPELGFKRSVDIRTFGFRTMQKVGIFTQVQVSFGGMPVAFRRHMPALNEFVDWILAAINLPGFKVATFLVSLVSVAISVWAFRRTKAVLDAHEKSILSDQIRFSNSEWQKVGRFVLSDEKYLALAAETFGFRSVDDARRTYFYFLYLNPAFCSYQAFKLGLMDRDVFGGGLKSVMHNFRGDSVELLGTIKLLGYPDDFVILCKNLLSERGR
jgi:hypothetical protein